jgi:hypothetical protein
MPSHAKLFSGSRLGWPIFDVRMALGDAEEAPCFCLKCLEARREIEKGGEGGRRGGFFLGACYQRPGLLLLGFSWHHEERHLHLHLTRDS